MRGNALTVGSAFSRIFSCGCNNANNALAGSLPNTFRALYQFYAPLLALLAHSIGPDACLYFAYVCFV